MYASKRDVLQVIESLASGDTFDRLDDNDVRVYFKTMLGQLSYGTDDAWREWAQAVRSGTETSCEYSDREAVADALDRALHLRQLLIRFVG